jgi:nucleotide-binding universal stress UspA family protein
MNEKNEMISRILVAVDGSRYSEKAFEYGLYLARKCRCSLLIVHVIEEFATVGHSISKELKHQDHLMLQEYESMAKKSSDSIASINTIETSGNDVTEEILKIADKESIDTIILGSRGTKASRDFHIGSVSYKVSHYAKCTVIIVR